MFYTKNATIWYMTNCWKLFLSKVIHNWLSELRSVEVLSWDQSQDTINRAIYQIVKNIDSND